MRSNRLRSGIMLIGTGGILLGNTMGFLDWFVWTELIRLWPALLVAFGIEMIFRHSRVPAVSYISPLLIAGCFLYAVYGGGAIADNRDSVEIVKSTFSVQNDQAKDITLLKVRMDLALGDFDFSAGSASFFEGEFESYGRKPKFDFKKDGDVGRVRVKYPQNSVKFRNFRGRGCNSSILLTDKVPVELNVDAGVVDLTLDLRDVQVSRLDIDSGVSDIMVRFGDKVDHVEASFDIGVSDLAIYIPDGTAVRLHKDTGLATVSFAGLGLQKIRKHLYESPGYDTAGSTIEIDIDAGVCDIELKYYDTGRTEL